MGEEKQKLLTREDVLRIVENIALREKGQELVLNRDCVLMLIRQNGGPENALDLSEMKFERGIDLHDIDLTRVILTKARLVEAHLEGANLREAHLEEANLRYAHLEKADLSEAHLTGANLMKARLEEADLRDAHLQETHLEEAFAEDAHLERAKLTGAHLEKIDLLKARLEEANLFCADLQRAILWESHLERANLARAYLNGADLANTYLKGTRLTEIRLSSDTKLQNARWGDYVLAEEIHGPLIEAIDSYRRLKQWYTNAGLYDTAAKFYYREKEVGRKSLRWRSKSTFWHRLALQLSYWVFGHGEGWKRLLFWVAGFILLFALIYFAIDETRQWQYFGDYIYFSTVSFTALGYGSWLYETNNWIKGIGAFESFIGVFSMALLLVTFVRKWTR